MREEKLQQIIEMIPIIQTLSEEDLVISVWDREATVLYCVKSKSFPANFHFDVGYKVTDRNDKLFVAMDTGKTVHNHIPKEVFGVTIEGNITPIFDNGKVVGCISCVYSLEKKEELENHAKELKAMLADSKDSINQILNAAINSSEYLNQVHEYMSKLESSVKGVYSVVEAIKGNTSRTKMLALNASIEAARAGESGKGFSIVANEMGKLSKMSADSVTEINETLNEMVSSITDVVNAVKKIDEVSYKNNSEVEKIIYDLNKVL